MSVKSGAGMRGTLAGSGTGGPGIRSEGAGRRLERPQRRLGEHTSARTAPPMTSAWGPNADAHRGVGRRGRAPESGGGNRRPG